MNRSEWGFNADSKKTVIPNFRVGENNKKADGYRIYSKICSNCNKNSDQKNWLPLPNISKPLNDYVCTLRSSLALEPVPEKNPGSPLFCYDERRNMFGLAGKVGD